MWGLPRPGIQPVSPALAGRFLSTAPPGKSTERDFMKEGREGEEEEEREEEKEGENGEEEHQQHEVVSGLTGNGFCNRLLMSVTGTIQE